MTKTKVRQAKTANRKAMLQTESMLAEMDRIREAPASDDWFMIEQDARSCAAVIVRNAIKSTGIHAAEFGDTNAKVLMATLATATAASRTSITAWGAVAAGEEGPGRPGYRSGGRMMLADAVRAAKEAGAAALNSSLNAQAVRLETPATAGAPLRQALLRWNEATSDALEHLEKWEEREKVKNPLRP